VKLHAINDDLKTTLWCGPAALAAISGKPASHCVLAIRHSLNPAYYHKPVKGVSNTILIRAAEKLGFSMTKCFEQINYAKGLILKFNQLPTLARFCREHRELLRRETILINITGHYVVVSGRSFIDNHTGKPVSLASAPHRRCRVQNAWIVRQVGPDIVPAPIPKPPPLPSIRATEALARKFEITVEPHLPGEYWVYPPPGFESQEIDPYYDEHLAYDANEARERVNRYIELIGSMRAGEVKVST
jgi:hypothetical protein